MGCLRSTQPSGRSRGRRALIACAILAAAAWGFAPASTAAADEPFRGAADIHLGENVHATFPNPAEGPHRYSFFATANTTISAVLKRDAGASGTPSLRLTYPGGLRIDLGPALKDGPRGPRIDHFPVRYAGTYVLEVVPGQGSAGYTLSTSGRIGKRQRGIFPVAPAGASSFAFDAQYGAKLSAIVAPKQTGPRIEITGLTAPSGEDIPVLSLQRGASAEIRDVILSEQGRFRLTWTNYGTPGDLQIQFRFGAPDATPVHELGVSDGVALTTVERGDPALPAQNGYVGSAACGRCHEELVRSWSATAHNSAVRSWNRAGLGGLTMANDANSNGADDFRDGLDLATTSAFAVYGAAAPKLSFAAGEAFPYQVRMGAATYPVHRTLGGHRQWMQRYLTKISGNDFVLPFEYDEVRKVYSAYRPRDWYDALNNPRVGTDVPRERSFEAQCSGCHNTGLVVAGGQSGVDTGYVEMNIGCEQCHGPGAAHAAGGDVRKIVNPRSLMTQAVPDPAAANDVCARCHSKGESVGTLPGLGAKSEYGFAGGHVAAPGDRIADFLVPTELASDFWGYKVNPLPSLPGDTTVAARSDRQQGPDILKGGHGPGGANAAACFDCHDPHRSRTEHQIVTSVTRDIRVATRADDNSLCLSCHAATSEFPGISVADAALIHGGNPPASVASGVIDHMKDIGMPVRPGFYDPVGTGVGRCITCHMPKTASSAGFGTDKGGFISGDLHSHRFEIVWPRASEMYGVTNSCSVCHPTAADDIVGPIITQWANPTLGHVSFHAATPPASQDGIALNAAINPSRDGGMLCIACHTSEGFRRVQVDGEALSADAVNEIAKESVARDRGVSCDACHGRRGDGQFYGTDRNPLRFDKADLCITCHNAATIEFSDFTGHGAVVRHPQKEMLAGNAGDAAPGAPATATTGHTNMADRCVTCHYDADHGIGRHDFKPLVATCAECHKGLGTFDRPASGDYDGNGQTSGIQTEVTGLLNRLKATLLLDPKMTFASGRYDYNGATNHALTGASQAQFRAVFNWYSVEDDGSRGVHNAARAIQLLQSSYRELTGTNIPGAVIR